MSYPPTGPAGGPPPADPSRPPAQPGEPGYPSPAGSIYGTPPGGYPQTAQLPTEGFGGTSVPGGYPQTAQLPTEGFGGTSVPGGYGAPAGSSSAPPFGGPVSGPPVPGPVFGSPVPTQQPYPGAQPSGPPLAPPMSGPPGSGAPYGPAAPGPSRGKGPLVLVLAIVAGLLFVLGGVMTGLYVTKSSEATKLTARVADRDGTIDANTKEIEQLKTDLQAANDKVKSIEQDLTGTKNDRDEQARQKQIIAKCLDQLTTALAAAAADDRAAYDAASKDLDKNCDEAQKYL